MEIKLQRLTDNGTSTTGKITVDDLSFVTMEDTFREEKIAGETRIPAGKYRIKLRQWGSHCQKYRIKFLTIHKGMLQIMDVPGFSDILMHIGNSARDTKGCILVGCKIENENLISGSTVAYLQLYQHILPALLKNEEVFIEISDNTVL
jgi:hypothetical protein